jgi:hypothetical protein
VRSPSVRVLAQRRGPRAAGWTGVRSASKSQEPLATFGKPAILERARRGALSPGHARKIFFKKYDASYCMHLISKSLRSCGNAVANHVSLSRVCHPQMAHGLQQVQTIRTECMTAIWGLARMKFLRNLGISWGHLAEGIDASALPRLELRQRATKNVHTATTGV